MLAQTLASNFQAQSSRLYRQRCSCSTLVETVCNAVSSKLALKSFYRSFSPCKLGIASSRVSKFDMPRNVQGCQLSMRAAEVSNGLNQPLLSKAFRNQEFLIASLTLAPYIERSYALSQQARELIANYKQAALLGPADHSCFLGGPSRPR